MRLNIKGVVSFCTLRETIMGKLIARQILDRIDPWGETWIVHLSNWLDPELSVKEST